MNTSFAKQIRIALTFAAALTLANCGSSGGQSGQALPPGFVVANSGPSTTNELVKIYSVDSRINPRHAPQINVQPGQIVNLKADLFANESIAEGRPATDFVWSSTASPNDVCDSALTACVGSSNFQATPRGVNYYVPVNMGQSLQIVVRAKSAVDRNGQQIFDTIVLNNLAFGRTPIGAVGPLQSAGLITSAAAYPAGQSFDPHVALNGMGQWVTLGETEYFVPTQIVTPAIPVFTPYQNGYWAQDPQQGMAWVSYDPWGWVTEHYGLWRHHGVYGWIWSPFRDRHFEPAAVTWMNQGEYIVWYPYSERYASFYTPEEGFIDGFWLHAGIGVKFGTPGFAYHPGFALCLAREIGNARVASILIAHDNPIFMTTVHGAFIGNHIFPYPGSRDLRGGLSFVANFGVPRAQIVRQQTHGGAQLFGIKGPHEIPAGPAHLLLEARQANAHMPLGAKIQDNNGHAVMIPPSKDLRGLNPEGDRKVQIPNNVPGSRAEKPFLPGSAPARDERLNAQSPAPKPVVTQASAPKAAPAPISRTAPSAARTETPKSTTLPRTETPRAQTQPRTTTTQPRPQAPAAQLEKRARPAAKSDSNQESGAKPSFAPTSDRRQQSEDNTQRGNRG